MAYTTPSVADFKVYFSRDFYYGTDPANSITDSDIAKAQQQANMQGNQSLWADQASWNVGYNLLTAHWMVMNIRQSSQGVNGQFTFPENSKAVGNVSQGFAVPDRVAQNPLWAMLTKTNYGAEYLQLLLPKLTGMVVSVYGRTHA